LKRSLIPLLAFVILAVGSSHSTGKAVAAERDLESLLAEFKEYSGAELVFRREELPEGRYHDVLKPLPDSKKAMAATICLEEVRMYPPGYFGEVGLKSVGVFAACASKLTTDRSRPFDKGLGGYRYFGVYNGSDAIAAAFYSDGQLALTFHHEIFHHVDSTVDGETESWQLSSDDAFYQYAISGIKPYTAPPIASDDLAALRDRCYGFTLEDAVSDYAAKNSREDQAETARHLMSMLSNSLAQAIEKPELAGSQRILHILREYERSVPDGPDFDWFVDVALQRARCDARPETVDQLLTRLRRYADGGSSGYAGVANDPPGARAALRAVIRVKPDIITGQQATELVQLATEISGALLRQRIRPDSSQQRFDIWGHEDSHGVNRTLRRDVARFASDAKRLHLIATIHQQDSDWSADPLPRAQLNRLRLIARYYVYIKSYWSMTPGTQEVFESTRRTILDTLADAESVLTEELQSTDLLELARQIPEA
jgi:hypothetical protein